MDNQKLIKILKAFNQKLNILKRNQDLLEKTMEKMIEATESYLLSRGVDSSWKDHVKTETDEDPELAIKMAEAEEDGTD